MKKRRIALAIISLLLLCAILLFITITSDIRNMENENYLVLFIDDSGTVDHGFLGDRTILEDLMGGTIETRPTIAETKDLLGESQRVDYIATVKDSFLADMLEGETVPLKYSFFDVTLPWRDVCAFVREEKDGLWLPVTTEYGSYRVLLPGSRLLEANPIIFVQLKNPLTNKMGNFGIYGQTLDTLCRTGRVSTSWEVSIANPLGDITKTIVYAVVTEEMISRLSINERVSIRVLSYTTELSPQKLILIFRGDPTDIDIGNDYKHKTYFLEKFSKRTLDERAALLILKYYKEGKIEVSPTPFTLRIIMYAPESILKYIAEKLIGTVKQPLTQMSFSISSSNAATGFSSSQLFNTWG